MASTGKDENEIDAPDSFLEKCYLLDLHWRKTEQILDKAFGVAYGQLVTKDGKLYKLLVSSLNNWGKSIRRAEIWALKDNWQKEDYVYKNEMSDILPYNDHAQ